MVSGDRQHAARLQEIGGRFRNGVVLTRADLETLATNYIYVASKHPTKQDRTYFFEKSVRNYGEPHIMIDEFTLSVRNIIGLGLYVTGFMLVILSIFSIAQVRMDVLLN